MVEEGTTEEEITVATMIEEARCERYRGGQLWLRGKKRQRRKIATASVRALAAIEVATVDVVVAEGRR
ncbi:hypothetical protein BHE74_00049911 [Ensete ventricosum]|nr:hypothetical protein BHE74_00049911 [Ensete ventricosum]